MIGQGPDEARRIAAMFLLFWIAVIMATVGFYYYLSSGST
jgi:hypothetical protein